MYNLPHIRPYLFNTVSNQSEQIQRIDANTDDVVDNVQGAQRELMKYWSRVSGNRWLVAKMFGVLMVRYAPRIELLIYISANDGARYSFFFGFSSRANQHILLGILHCICDGVWWLFRQQANCIDPV